MDFILCVELVSWMHLHSSVNVYIFDMIIPLLLNFLTLSIHGYWDIIFKSPKQINNLYCLPPHRFIPLFFYQDVLTYKCLGTWHFWTSSYLRLSQSILLTTFNHLKWNNVVASRNQLVEHCVLCTSTDQLPQNISIKSAV